MSKDSEKIVRWGYNERYKEFDTENRCPNYLRKENLCRLGVGEGVWGLVKLRCENMEEGNKYYLDKKYRECIFCEIGIDCMEHHMEECPWFKQLGSSWFKKLGKDKEKIWKKLWSEELNSVKVVDKLEKERKKEISKMKTEEKTTSKVKNVE